jgi:D-alanyl-D-alanine dipeptidase
MRKVNQYIFFSILIFIAISLNGQGVPTDTSFTDMHKLDPSIELDFKYATEDNFLKTKVYPCETCLLRYEVAIALLEAQKEANRKGYQLILYDCYRPYSVQLQMWKVMPNSRYVANPHNGKSSIHNRGGAVDVSLADIEGNLLDMGTEFDYFGPEAAHSFIDLPEKVLQNRILLKSIMKKAGFLPIRSEWWHYSFYKAKSYPISNQKLPCK